MVINVVVFASLKDILGGSRHQVDLSTRASVAEVVDHLSRRYPGLDARVPFLRYAVNDSLVESSHELSDRDELALLPPTSGG